MNKPETLFASLSGSGSTKSSAVARTGVQFLIRNGMVLFFIGLLLAVSLSESSFLTKDNIQGLALQWAPIGLMAVAMTFVIIGGGFDLSVGGTYAMATVLYAEMSKSGYNVVVAVAICIGVGALIGILNGLVITWARVNAFVATLGSGYIIGGLALVITEGTPVGITTGSYLKIGQSSLFGWPIPVWVLAAAMLIGGLVLSQSVYGKKIFSIGGNPEASRLAGLRVPALQTSTYVLTGMAAALGGVMIAAQLGTGQGNAGVGIELQVITVVLAGGIAPSGGEGAMWRTLIGLAILATLANAFDLLQISAFWHSVVTGGILIAALALDALGKRLKPVRAAAPTAPTSGVDPPSHIEGTESATGA